MNDKSKSFNEQKYYSEYKKTRNKGSSANRVGDLGVSSCLYSLVIKG